MVNRIRNNQSGILMILALMAISVFALTILATVSIIGSGELVKSASVTASEKTFQAAEAGIEEALYRLAKNPTLTDFSLNVDGVGVSIAVAPSGFQRVLTSAATDVTGKKRTVRITADTNSYFGGFGFAVQGGANGVEIDNATVDGDMFSNGTIIGRNGATVNGDVTVAGVTSVLDQQVTTNAGNLSFGKKYTGNIEFAAQSFTSTLSQGLKKISLYLSKINTPDNLSLSIVNDNAESPGTTVISTGTVFAYTVTAGLYGWVDVSFPSPSALVAGTKYWIKLQDSSNNKNDAWLWASDPSDTYAGGTGKKSTNGTAWTSAGGDLNFKIIMGLADTKLDNVYVNGDARVNTISGGTVVSGDAYFQTLTGSTVNGTQYPGSADPAQRELPIKDSDIEQWTDDINAIGNPVLAPNPANTATCPSIYQTGTYYCIMTNTPLGNQRINGNVYVDGDIILTLTGNLWINGDVRFNGAGNAGKVQMSGSLGSSSAFIITDGVIEILNNYEFFSSGDPHSFLLLISKSANITPSQPEAAITASNNSSSIIVAAPHGEVLITNNGNLKASAAEKLHLNNGSHVIFDPNIASLFIPTTQPKTVDTVANTWEEI